MSDRALRSNIGRQGLNSIFLVGEVVDMGVSPMPRGVCTRARLKIRTPSRRSSYVFLDVYGKHSCGEIMTAICQTGNIVYIEGEFRNATLDKVNLRPYVLVTHIECLLRRRDVLPPNTDVINLLDELDPIGYAPIIKNSRRKQKKEG